MRPGVNLPLDLDPDIGFTHRFGASHRLGLDEAVNPTQDGRKKRPRYRNLGHLEAGVAGMPDHFRANLDQPGLQGAQRPVADRTNG